MSERVQPDSGDLSEPIPPRFWWLKRIAVGIVLLVVTLGILRWWWGTQASRMLQAEINAYVDAGQPLSPEDFDSPPVPDGENAAILLKQAVEALTLTKDQRRLMSDLRSDLGKMAGRGDEIDEIMEAGARTRILVRAARSLPAADWGFRAVGLSSPPPQFLPHEVAIRMLSIAASREHDHGNDAEAVEILRDILAYGRHLEPSRCLLASLLDHGASDLVSDAVENMAPTLRVADGAAVQDKPVKLARREQVRALITDLRDEEALREGLVWSFYRERAFKVEAIQMITSGQAGMRLLFGPWRSSPTGVRGLWAFILKPMFELDEAWMLRRATAVVQAASAPNYPEARRRLPATPPRSRWRGLAGVSHILSALSTPQFTNTIERTFKPLTRRRMAAVALAIRLYELDQGQLPDTLDGLVPAYLPDIPEDPFSDDGRNIGYRLDDDRPVLHSIGPRDDEKNTKAGRILFSLEGDRPPER